MDQRTQAAATAQAFLEARHSASGLPEFPGPVPATLEQGYSVQDVAIAGQDDTVAGWKVGRIGPPRDAELGANRLIGPIFAASIVTAAPSPAMPIFTAGFGAAEAEYLLRVGIAPDPDRTEWSIDDAIAHIDAVHVGIEIASSPYPGINSMGPTVTVADFGNNNGLVIGDAIAGWQDQAFIDWPVALTIDGVEAGAATARTMLDGPFGAAAFLFGLAARRGIAIKAGEWISSGAVTGVHPVREGARVEAMFGPSGQMRLDCTIIAATARQE